MGNIYIRFLILTDNTTKRLRSALQKTTNVDSEHRDLYIYTSQNIIFTRLKRVQIDSEQNRLSEKKNRLSEKKSIDCILLIPELSCSTIFSLRAVVRFRRAAIPAMLSGSSSE